MMAFHVDAAYADAMDRKSLSRVLLERVTGNDPNLDMANINRGIPMVWFSADKHLFHDMMILGMRNCSECEVRLKSQNIEQSGLSQCCKAPVMQTAPPPRPMFKTIEEMNRTIISNHNDFVAKGDLVYELGDLFLKIDPKTARDVRHQMKGNFYFVPGNHDQVAELIPDCFVWMKELVRIKPVGFHTPHIVLSHYSMRTWNGKHRDTWQLYGHSHGQLPEDVSLSFDVGVDTNNFFPYSIEDVIKKMVGKMPGWLEYKKSLKGTRRAE